MSNYNNSYNVFNNQKRCTLLKQTQQAPMKRMSCPGVGDNNSNKNSTNFSFSHPQLIQKQQQQQQQQPQYSHDDLHTEYQYSHPKAALGSGNVNGKQNNPRHRFSNSQLSNVMSDYEPVSLSQSYSNNLQQHNNDQHNNYSSSNNINGGNGLSFQRRNTTYDGKVPPLSQVEHNRKSFLMNNCNMSSARSLDDLNLAGLTNKTKKKRPRGGVKLDFSSVHDVPSFMQLLRLHKYTSGIVDADYTLETLLDISDAQLEAAGVIAQGARTRLLVALRKLNQDENRTEIVERSRQKEAYEDLADCIERETEIMQSILISDPALNLCQSVPNSPIMRSRSLFEESFSMSSLSDNTNIFRPTKNDIGIVRSSVSDQDLSPLMFPIEIENPSQTQSQTSSSVTPIGSLGKIGNGITNNYGSGNRSNSIGDEKSKRQPYLQQQQQNGQFQQPNNITGSLLAHSLSSQQPRYSSLSSLSDFDFGHHISPSTYSQFNSCHSEVRDGNTPTITTTTSTISNDNNDNMNDNNSLHPHDLFTFRDDQRDNSLHKAKSFLSEPNLYSLSFHSHESLNNKSHFPSSSSSSHLAGKRVQSHLSLTPTPILGPIMPYTNEDSNNSTRQQTTYYNHFLPSQEPDEQTQHHDVGLAKTETAKVPKISKPEQSALESFNYNFSYLGDPHDQDNNFQASSHISMVEAFERANLKDFNNTLLAETNNAPSFYPTAASKLSSLSLQQSQFQQQQSPYGKTTTQFSFLEENSKSHVGDNKYKMTYPSARSGTGAFSHGTFTSQY